MREQKRVEEWFAWAIQCYAQGHSRQGRSASRQLKRLAPGGFHDCMLDGMQLFLGDRFEEALAAYDRALAAMPASSLAHAHRGVVLMCLQLDEESLAAFERALQLDPDNPVALSHLGNAYLFLKRYDEALKLAERVLAQGLVVALPLLRVRTTALYKLERYDEALVSAEQVIVLAPGKVFGYAAKADALEQLGRLDEALQAYERALRYSPGNAVLWTRMARVLLQLELAGDALVAYERALRIEAEDLAAHNGKALALMELGRYGEALRVLDLALRMHPGNPVLLGNREQVIEALTPPDGQPGSESPRRPRSLWKVVTVSLPGASSLLRRHRKLIGWTGAGALVVASGLILLFHPDLRPLLDASLRALLIAALPLYPLACWFGWGKLRRHGFNPRALRRVPATGWLPPRYVWRRPSPLDLWTRLVRANLVGALYLLGSASLLQICGSLLQERADAFTVGVFLAENLLFLLHVLALVLTGLLFCAWPLIGPALRALSRLAAQVRPGRFRRRMAAREQE
jgi:tetratricopeptide (TPR) repeat protein